MIATTYAKTTDPSGKSGSRQMLDAVREFSPAVEYYSIDECFFLAVPLPGRSMQEIAEALRDHVLRTVHVPVTVGIARTRTLAKLVSDTAKPFGALALLDVDAERALLDRHPMTAISGIAKRGAGGAAAGQPVVQEDHPADADDRAEGEGEVIPGVHDAAQSGHGELPRSRWPSDPAWSAARPFRVHHVI
jgi:hypothetical protein